MDSTMRRCNNCGQFEHDPAAEACSKCGKELDPVPAAPAPPPAVPVAPPVPVPAPPVVLPVQPIDNLTPESA